jgi:hypothetical protein
MTRKDRIVEVLRSALGANDNPGEPGATVIINGNVGAVFVDKKNGMRLSETRQAPSSIALNRQNYTSRQVVMSILDSLPPLPAHMACRVADPKVGSRAFEQAIERALRTS